MNLVTRIAIVAVAVAANALADVATKVDARTSLALADSRGAQTSSAGDATSLDEYVGRYQAEGVEFVVFVENDSLVIELPENWGIAESRLRSEGAGELFVADVSVVVSFQTDADGRVTGLTAYPPQGESAVTAAKTKFRRGIVTIEDVVEDASPRVQIAAATE